MLKRIGFTAMILAALLVLLTPAPAHAKVRFGVTIGTPGYVYPADPYYTYPYPYSDYYYSRPIPYYGPAYVAPYPSYNYSFGWRSRDHERHERWEHRERERFEHHRR